MVRTLSPWLTIELIIRYFGHLLLAILRCTVPGRQQIIIGEYLLRVGHLGHHKRRDTHILQDYLSRVGSRPRHFLPPNYLRCCRLFVLLDANLELRALLDKV